MATTNRGLSGSTSISPNALDLRPTTADPISQPSPTLFDVLSPRSAAGPLPLPSFVFPAKAPSKAPSKAPASAPSSYSRGSGRRPLSAIEVKGGLDKMDERDSLHTPELPAFSFGGSSTSAPASPRSRSNPTRPGSHQRGTSEFIGGDGASGTSTVPMSTSPTAGDTSLPQPTGFGPLGGRRGHRHVRSAAISYHDITMILKPPNSPTETRGSSAPTSPAGDQKVQQSGFSASMDAVVQNGVDGSEPTDSTIPPREPLRALNRARVGFSDNVEVIPRPLSLISSDSSSTVTARQGGHSVSNSISSIISAGATSPPSQDKRGMPSPSRKHMDSRPHTAEPVLDRGRVEHQDEPKRRNSIPLLMEAALASSPPQSTPRSAKKWTFFGHDSNSGESSPKSRPTSAGSGGKENKVVHSGTFPKEADLAAACEPLPSIERTNSRRSSISRKPSKKQKKVRSWAGSILSRKTRQRSQTKQKMSRRSPTPPHRSYPPLDETSRYENLQPELQTPVAEPENDIASWKPRRLPPQDDDSMSPMIDLDAALGPFNTPSSFGDEWESSQKTGPKKRAMHSAAGLGGFAGPGMHYHRRAESAPEFQNPRFGLHRLGSSSTMAMEDVFEEDEDEWEDTKASSDKEDANNAAEEDVSIGLGIDIKVEDTDESESERAMSVGADDVTSWEIKRKRSSLSDGDRRTTGTAKSVHSATSLMDEPIIEESTGAIEILDDSTPARPDSRARSSDSTATPPFRPRAGKELAPVDIQPFSLSPPYLTPTSTRSTAQSSLPSPRSPFSYDTQRISTTPSSVTGERGFQSLLLGEPGPELRYSVDDVPSLTSSNSTMTRESGLPGAGNPQFRDGQRSASLSAAATRKRSSMASLSRLISSSHGEKSKLSVESRPTGKADSEKKDKSTKSKRISRLMQFWKSRDAPT